MKKILTIILSILFAFALGFSVVWTCINFDKVKNGINGSELYTRAELEEYGNNMYNQGLQDKEEYLEQINQYRDTITHLNDEISKYKYDIQVNNENINSLTTQRDGYKKELEETKILLEEEKLKSDASAETISELESNVTKLSKSIESKDKQIADLKKENVDALKSIDYYENFIKTLETETSVVATFVYDGQVVHLEVITKGSCSTYTNPSDTDYSKFNYWMVNDEKVILSEYPLNANTTFVANIDKSFDVKFLVDDSEYNAQIVIEGETLTLPSAPTKENYTFLGWSTDGVNVIDNLESFNVTYNITFYALFQKYNTVTFMMGDTVLDTQSIMENSNAILPEEPSKGKGYTFLGWSLDNENIVNNIANIPVTADAVYYAVFSFEPYFEKITYNISFNGLDVWYDNEDVYYSLSDSYILNKETGNWDSVSFKYISGGTRYNLDIEGEYVWHCGNRTFYSDIIGYSYERVSGTFEWEEITFNGFDNIVGKYVWTDGVNIYYSDGSSQYAFNSATNTWITKTWYGLTSFNGSRVWTDGGNIYYSDGSSQYILDKSTSTWKVKVWNGNNSFSGYYIWTDGEDIYYSYYEVSGNKIVNHCEMQLDKETSTWVDVDWDCYLDGSCYWTDGESHYISRALTGSYKLITE